MSYLFGTSSRMALAVSATVAVLSAPAAYAQTVRSFDIAPQPAASAVQDFARQSGLQILASGSDLEGLRTNAVKGSFTPEAALKNLISGTGLTVKSNDGRVVVLARAQAQDVASHADTAQGIAPAEEPQEVVVVGMRRSMRDAIAQKKANSGVAEYVSAKEIGVLPDVTIAETLARLPGVNTSRDRGNDSQAAIRGIGPRMVLGTINGREVATSEPDRNVRWEIYPSEVVAGAAVYKSSEARLLSGGISGTVDLQTIRPMQYSGPEFVARAGTVYYDGGSEFPGYDRTGWRASGSWVKKVNDQLAFVIGLTGQNQKNGYESFRGWGYNDDTIRAGDMTGPIVTGGADVPTPWGAGAQAKFLDAQRLGASAGLQYRPNERFELTYDLLYSKYKIDEKQDQAYYGDGNWGNWDGANVDSFANPVIVNGDLVGATTEWSKYTSVISRYEEDKTLLVTGLNGKWTLENWIVSADLSYSTAERENIWRSVEMDYWPESMTWRLGEDPHISVSQQPDAATFTPQAGAANPGRVKDELTAAQLDFRRDFNGDFWTNLQFGARFADRTKSEAVGYDEEQAPLAGVMVDGSTLKAYEFKNFDIPAMLDGNFDSLLATVYGANASQIDSGSIPFNSEVTEKIGEAYVQGNFDTTFLNARAVGNVGVRVVDVESRSTGDSTITRWVEETPDNWVPQDEITRVTQGVSYTKVLPSASVSLEVRPSVYLKLGAARVMSRPPLNELRVNRSLSPDQPYTGSAGNPLLKPFEADQLDISYEQYFASEALFAVSGYYKKVSNYVGYNQRAETIDGNNYTLTSPVNSDKGGHISGVEFTLQSPFSLISDVPVLRDMGVYANLALVSSDIREMVPGDNPLPMVGIADQTAIFDLWYSANGFEARLGAKYNSEYTALMGWDSTALVRVRPSTTLDFSASYAVTPAVSVRFQAGNLLDTPSEVYTDYQRQRTGDLEYYGRRFLMDLTVKF